MIKHIFIERFSNTIPEIVFSFDGNSSGVFILIAVSITITIFTALISFFGIMFLVVITKVVAHVGKAATLAMKAVALSSLPVFEQEH